MTQDKTFGGVTWAASEECGPPDVGISVYLGENDSLWCGEISLAMFEDAGAGEYFDSDGGWFIVRYCPDPIIIAKCGDQHDARAFIEAIAWLCREAGAPTVAKTLGQMK